MGARHGVVIVGAGPGGAATAHYLAKHGLDVLLLDKSDFPRDKTCGDGLTPARFIYWLTWASWKRYGRSAAPSGKRKSLHQKGTRLPPRSRSMTAYPHI